MLLLLLVISKGLVLLPVITGQDALEPILEGRSSQACDNSDATGGKTTDSYLCYNCRDGVATMCYTPEIAQIQLSGWDGYVLYADVTGYPYSGNWWGNVILPTQNHGKASGWKEYSYGSDPLAKDWEKRLKMDWKGDQVCLHINATASPIPDDTTTGSYRPTCHRLGLCIYRSAATDPCTYISLCPNATGSYSCKDLPVDGTAFTIGQKSSINRTIVLVSSSLGADLSWNSRYTQMGNALTLYSDNTWYAATSQLARHVAPEGDCYACSLFPSSSADSSLVRPRPYSARETVCILLGLANRYRNATASVWWHMDTTGMPNCTAFDEIRVRVSPLSAEKQRQTLMQPVMHIPPSQIPNSIPVCFQRKRTGMMAEVQLGNTAGCQTILPSTCGHGSAAGGHSVTDCLVGQFRRGSSSLIDSTTAQLVSWPSDDGISCPIDAAWLCGTAIYQILPSGWTGTCALVYLTPSITIHNKLMYTTHHYTHYRPRPRRDTGTVTDHGTKFLSGLVPWWGAVNNAHNVDKLHVQLENLTSIVLNGFNTLNPFAAAVQQMLMQHQLALDLLFAAQGGLCHVIGEKCCTFVPAISGNLTDTVKHLNELLQEMKDDETTSKDQGWDFWSWLWPASWMERLRNLAVPVAAGLLLFCVLITCIIPCVQGCVRRTVNIQVVDTYTRLHDYRPPSPPTSDTEDDDSLDDVRDKEDEDTV